MAPAGVWGEPSSTIDWCEENYVVTRYIAEFWNTVSNVAMIVPPLMTVLLLIRQRFENMFIACHISLLCVGIGSWLFHMTLTYSMQLFDELPMLWGSGCLIYAFLEVKSPPNKLNIPLLVAVFTYCLTVTIVYVIWKAPIFFQAAYGIEVLCVIFISIYTIRTLENCDKSLFYKALVIYGTGFCLWNIDNNYCVSLKYMRSILGPFAPVFQFHALWHVFAGMGTYMDLLFIAKCRCMVLRKSVQVKHWMNIWPYLEIDSPILPR